MQWGSNVKGSSVLQNISKGMFSLWKGCANLFCSQVGRDRLPLQELNKGTLFHSHAEGQGPPGKPLTMIIIIKASQRNSFHHAVRIGFLLGDNSPLSKSNPQSCGRKREWQTFCLVRWIFLGVSIIFANVSHVEICLLVPLLESVYFTPVDLEMLNFKSMRQDLKLRNLVLFYVWEDSGARAH